MVCPACGEATRAAWPLGGPPGGFGPRLQATMALGTGAYHLSTRTTQDLWEVFFGVALGLGRITNLEQATTQAVAQAVAEARASVQTQPAADADATGWREGQPRAWLWTAVTEWVTVLVVRRWRRAKVAQELLGERFWGRCQLNGYICKNWLSSGTLSSFRDHFMAISGMSELHKRMTYAESGRCVIAHQLS